MPFTPTATQAGLSYQFFSGWHAGPVDSADAYTRFDANFRFTTGGGWAVIPIVVPNGAVIKEIEFYVNRLTAGAFSCEVWRSTTAGSSASQANVAVPATLGQQTITIPLSSNNVASSSTELMPFVNFAAGVGICYGVRVGYTGPSQLFLLPSPTRVYDSRPGQSPGDGPFTVGVTRTINCATGVPAGATGALLNVTIDGTVGGGYLQVYSEALGSPPSASSANWSSNGLSQANSVTTAVNASKIKITCGGNPGSSTNVLVDVIGYYQ